MTNNNAPLNQPVFNKLKLLNNDLLPVNKVPYDALPNSCKEFIFDVSSRLGCAPDYLVSGTLTALSSRWVGK